MLFEGVLEISIVVIREPRVLGLLAALGWLELNVAQ